ncbi:glycoside hydrolase family 76 protein [Desertivirga brevis]|uniref:glycoside hydrolase family 76 protein n=1 Tax=Desertivirga brevis TaxID=2810310 RepID=UPI001A973B0B|nr:glycoside hydrolase family 76 protein [Pedobacter sp. SYSU D00873]
MINQLIANAFLLITLCLSAKAQTSKSNDRIKTIYNNINTVFREEKTGLYFETTDPKHNENPHSWLWPLCALIQASNELEELNPRKDYMSPVVRAIDEYYNDEKPEPGYQDYVRKERLSSRFYDDNQWIAIAYLDAYNRNHKQKYLDVAKMIYKFMMTGHDTITGGGLYWKEKDYTTKNTCSNGPGILVALQLYKLTKDKQYLNTALSLYDWTNKHLRAPEGIYYDAIKIPSGNIDKAAYTYNTGTMLQSNALLYQLTGDVKYLKEAQTIAAAGKARFYKGNKLPNEYWFNAVMFRGYIELYKIDKNRDWIQFYIDDAERVWKEERDGRNLLGTKDHKRLIDQAGMLETYARIEQLRSK